MRRGILDDQISCFETHHLTRATTAPARAEMNANQGLRINFQKFSPPETKSFKRTINGRITAPPRPLTSPRHVSHRTRYTR